MFLLLSGRTLTYFNTGIDVLPQLALVLTGVFWSHDSTALSLDNPGLDVEWLESLALDSVLSREPKAKKNTLQVLIVLTVYWTRTPIIYSKLLNWQSDVKWFCPHDY